MTSRRPQWCPRTSALRRSHSPQPPGRGRGAMQVIASKVLTMIKWWFFSMNIMNIRHWNHKNWGFQGCNPEKNWIQTHLTNER